MNNKVQNPKIELDSSIEMNDENYLNDILETEKNMSVNFTYALNASYSLGKAWTQEWAIVPKALTPNHSSHVTHDVPETPAI